MDQKLKGIPASLSESLLGNQTVTGGGRNALIGNCLFLLTPRYLPSLGFAQPVGRQAGAEPSWVTVAGMERSWGLLPLGAGPLAGEDTAWRDFPHIGDRECASFSNFLVWFFFFLIFSPISIPLLIR